jgi:hypothetical protein
MSPSDCGQVAGGPVSDYSLEQVQTALIRVSNACIFPPLPIPWWFAHTGVTVADSWGTEPDPDTDYLQPSWILNLEEKLNCAEDQLRTRSHKLTSSALSTTTSTRAVPVHRILPPGDLQSGPRQRGRESPRRWKGAPVRGACRIDTGRGERRGPPFFHMPYSSHSTSNRGS